MKTVHKYILPGTGECLLMLPVGAEVLTVQMQNSRICLWAKVDDGGILAQRNFFVEGTGWELPEGELEYIATVQQHVYVWHVFERKG